MRRYLSHTLIAILVLICPLSFSTDRVPDFTPACDIQSARGAAASVVAVAARPVAVAPSIQKDTCVPNHLSLPPSRPLNNWFRALSHGRAPPSAPFSL